MVYKYAGVMENMERGADLEGPGGIYYVRVSARLFAPFFSATVFRPKRRGAWRIRTEPFDCRCAQYSYAPQTRDGDWYSRSEASLSGSIELVCPVSDTDSPNPIRAKIRISRRPAHVAIKWLDGGDSRRKLSARTPEGACEWYSVVYDVSVFDTDIRARYWRAFIDNDPAPCPSRHASNVETNTTTRDTEKSEFLAAQERTGRAPTLTDPQGGDGEKESSHSHSTNQSWGYGGDWNGSRWHGRTQVGDWWGNYQQGENDEASASGHDLWADYPIETPRNEKDPIAPNETHPSAKVSPVNDTQPPLSIMCPTILNCHGL